MRVSLKYLHGKTFCFHYANIFCTPRPIIAVVLHGSKLTPGFIKLIFSTFPLSYVRWWLFMRTTQLWCSWQNFLLRTTIYISTYANLKAFSKWQIKFNSNKSQTVISTCNHSIPPPLILDGSLIRAEGNISPPVPILPSDGRRNFWVYSWPTLSLGASESTFQKFNIAKKSSIQ